jgi:hypothetical protein
MPPQCTGAPVGSQYKLNVVVLEYRQAIERGIPALIFLLDEDAPWLPKFIDGGKAGKQLKALREEFKEKRLVSFFRNPDQLGSLVTAAIALHSEIRSTQENSLAKQKTERMGTSKTVVGLRFSDVGNSFRDRRPELAKLQSWLCNPSSKFVCIVGLSGNGKTALLSKLCALIESGEFQPTQTNEHVGAQRIIYINLRRVLLQITRLQIHTCGNL